MNINSNSGQFKTQGDTIKLSEQHFKMKTANLWEQKVSPSFKKNGRSASADRPEQVWSVPRVVLNNASQMHWSREQEEIKTQPNCCLKMFPGTSVHCSVSVSLSNIMR